MNELEFLSAKSLISNINLVQALELKEIIKDNINENKIKNIKIFLIKEFKKYPQLEKYLDLINNIEKIKTKFKNIREKSSYFLIFYFKRKQGNIKLNIENNNNNEYITVSLNRKPIEEEEIKNFGEKFLKDYEINDELPGWNSAITGYLVLKKEKFEKYYGNII